MRSEDIPSSLLDKKLLLIINPVSGRRTILKYLPEVINIFQKVGYVCTVMITQNRGDGLRFTEKYANEYDLVVCTGGDGSLYETVNGIAKQNFHIPLGYIPCGTTNVFALTHNLSLNILNAARNIVSGRVDTLDIGKFGNQYFTYVAAFGAFCELSTKTSQYRKNQLGRAAYFLDGIKDLGKIKPIYMKITVDDVVYEGEYLFGAITNATNVGGVFELPKNQVNFSDGKMELLLIKKPQKPLDIYKILHAMFNQDYSSENIILTRGSEFHIENPELIEFYLDGEMSDILPEIDVTVLPNFLSLAY